MIALVFTHETPFNILDNIDVASQNGSIFLAFLTFNNFIRIAMVRMIDVGTLKRK